jgi:hypothetical protein
MVYFAGSSIGWPKDAKELEQEAYKLFKGWGGFDSAAAAIPQFDWTQFAPLPLVPSELAQAVVTITIDAPPNVTVKVVRARARRRRARSSR